MREGEGFYDSDEYHQQLMSKEFEYTGNKESAEYDDNEYDDYNDISEDWWLNKFNKNWIRNLESSRV